MLENLSPKMPKCKQDAKSKIYKIYKEQKSFNKTMLFTYSEFQEVKNKIVNDFQSKPEGSLKSLQEECISNLQKYQNLLNTLRNQNRQKRVKILQRTNDLRKVGMKEILGQRKKIKTLLNQIPSCPRISQIYVTEAQESKCPGKCDSKSHTEDEDQTGILKKKQGQIKLFQINLITEVNKLESSIRYFRRRVKEMENQVKEKGLKKRIFENKVQEISINLSNRKRNNFDLSHNIKNKEKVFMRSLETLRMSKDIDKKKAQYVVDELAEKILVYNKKQKKIKDQQKMILDLESDRDNLCQSIQTRDQLVRRSQLVLDAYKMMTNLKQRSYKKIHKSLRDDQSCEEDDVELIEISKEMSEFIQKMKEDQEGFRKQYELKMEQKEELESTLRAIKQDEEHFFWDQYIKNGLNQSSAYPKEEELSLKKLSKTVKKITSIAISFEDRLFYLLKKQIIKLNYVIRNWVKHDNSALEFMDQVNDELDSVIKLVKEPIKPTELRHLLTDFFEKYEDYNFFSDTIFQNFFINKYLSESLLVKYLKRIIKTKVNKLGLPTEKIFEAALHEINEKSIQFWFQKTRKLLSNAKKIYEYASKFQILIVNSKQDKGNLKIIEESNKQKSEKKTSKKMKISGEIGRQSEDVIESPTYKRSKLNPQDDNLKLHHLILSYQENLKTVTKLSKMNQKV